MIGLIPKETHWSNYVKTTLIQLVILTFGVGLGFPMGYYVGRKNTLGDFTHEKCWLNEQTRDINCIAFIE